MALAEAEADLQRHDAALLRLQGELMASRLEVSGAREETVQFRGMLHRAEEAAATAASAAHARIVSLEADAIGRDAEIIRLHAAITTLQAEIHAIRAGMDLLRASFSWRISAPVRAVGGVIRAIRSTLVRGIGATRPGLRHAVLPSGVPPPLPLPLPAPADRAARAIVQPAPLADPHPAAEEGVVTLDALYQLSRAI
jgi:hypothetical protein